MGYLFKIFLVALGLYYLFKLLTNKKTPADSNSSNTQFRKDPSQPSQKTDNSAKGEGEYVDYEEVD